MTQIGFGVLNDHWRWPISLFSHAHKLYHFSYWSTPPPWTFSRWTKGRSCWRLAPVLLTLNWPCPDVSASRVLNLNVMAVFYLELPVDHPQLPIAMKVLRNQHILPFFWRFSWISLHLHLRCSNFGFSGESVHSTRNMFIGCCGWLLKLFPILLNRFPTHVELLHNFLIGDASSL